MKTSLTDANALIEMETPYRMIAVDRAMKILGAAYHIRTVKRSISMNLLIKHLRQVFFSGYMHCIFVGNIRFNQEG